MAWWVVIDWRSGGSRRGAAVRLDLPLAVSSRLPSHEPSTLTLGSSFSDSLLDRDNSSDLRYNALCHYKNIILHYLSRIWILCLPYKRYRRSRRNPLWDLRNRNIVRCRHRHCALSAIIPRCSISSFVEAKEPHQESHKKKQRRATDRDASNGSRAYWPR